MKQLILNTTDTKQGIVNFINAVNVVNRYVGSIQIAQLPSLMYPPRHYGDFAVSMTNAKINVATWTNEVIPEFEIIPKSFINFNLTLQSQLNQIKKDLIQLASSPSNTSLVRDIKKNLIALAKESSIIKKTLTSLETNITSYQNSIIPDAKTLSALVQQIIKAEGADEDAIKLIKGSLKDLQDLVDSRNEIAKLDTILNFAIGIFLVAVGVAIGIAFTGGLGIIIGGVVGLGGTGYTTFESVNPDTDFAESMKEIQADMNRINKEIGLINSTIGLLQHLSDTFETIVSHSSEANVQIRNIINFWDNLESEVISLSNQIENVISMDPINEFIDNAIIDINKAMASWNDVVDFMKIIQDLKFKTVHPYPIKK